MGSLSLSRGRLSFLLSTVGLTVPATSGVREELSLLLSARQALFSLFIFLFFIFRASLVLPSTLAAAGGPWAGPLEGREREAEFRLYLPYLTA